MQSTVLPLFRPRTWLISFRYAAFVEYAVLPRTMKVRRDHVGTVRRVDIKMPDLGLDGFFRRTGLPWYVAAFLLVFLGTVEIGSLWGFCTALGPAGAGVSIQTLTNLIIGATLPLIALGFCLTLISSAAVQANRIATMLDLQRFAQVVSVHDPEAFPPTGERTYLDLAQYAAGLRRRLAAAENQQLSLSREIAAGFERD